MFSKYILSLWLFLLVLSSARAQDKNVKVNRQISFTYNQDSTCLNKKDTKKAVKLFYDFFDAIDEDRYEEYIGSLSPLTLEEIIPMKLERKFGKFKSYDVQFVGKNNVVRSIYPYTVESFEENLVYICVVRLPEDKHIVNRVGFDPLKKSTFPEVENYVALHFVKVGRAMKVVIPW